MADGPESSGFLKSQWRDSNVHVHPIAKKKWPATIGVLIFGLGVIGATASQAPPENMQLVAGPSFWGGIALLIVFFAVRSRNKAIYDAYVMIDALGSLTSLEERLSAFAQDTQSAKSATRQASATQFHRLFQAMDEAGFEMAEKLEDYLPGADLAVGKQRRQGAIQAEFDRRANA